MFPKSSVILLPLSLPMPALPVMGPLFFVENYKSMQTQVSFFRLCNLQRRTQPGDTCIYIAKAPTYVITLSRFILCDLAQPQAVDDGEPRNHQFTVHQFIPWRSKSSASPSFFAVLTQSHLNFLSRPANLSWSCRSRVFQNLRCRAWRHLPRDCW